MRRRIRIGDPENIIPHQEAVALAQVPEPQPDGLLAAALQGKLLDLRHKRSCANPGSQRHGGSILPRLPDRRCHWRAFPRHVRHPTAKRHRSGFEKERHQHQGDAQSQPYAQRFHPRPRVCIHEQQGPQDTHKPRQHEPVCNDHSIQQPAAAGTKHQQQRHHHHARHTDDSRHDPLR